MSITVIDVIRDLSIEPTPALTWSVGSAVRDAYEKKFGHEPPKVLRTKTSGGGSHCFAVYPRSFRPEMERIIRSHQTESARQMSLFEEKST